MATLVPCLVKLRAEFNAINPDRDKSSDGWIGDEAHQASRSDHNPDSRGLVHAIDVDETGPWDGESFMAKVDRVRTAHRDGKDDRLTYIIYEGRIASAKYGWVWRTYSGASPHDKHAHFSADDLPSRENSTRSFGVARPAPPKEEPVALTDAELTAIANKVWSTRFQIPGTTGEENQRTAEQLLRWLFSMEKIAARVDELVDEESIAAEIQKVRGDLQSIMSDPEDRDGGGEADPIVRKIRYAEANPPAGV